MKLSTTAYCEPDPLQLVSPSFHWAIFAIYKDISVINKQLNLFLRQSGQCIFTNLLQHFVDIATRILFARHFKVLHVKLTSDHLITPLISKVSQDNEISRRHSFINQ